MYIDRRSRFFISLHIYNYIHVREGTNVCAYKCNPFPLILNGEPPQIETRKVFSLSGDIFSLPSLLRALAPAQAFAPAPSLALAPARAFALALAPALPPAFALTLAFAVAPALALATALAPDPPNAN